MLSRQGDSPSVPTQGDSPRLSRNSTHKSDSAGKIPVSDLHHYLQHWFTDAKIKGHTRQSTESRQARIGKFFWFLEHKGYSEVGAPELKEFFLYLQTAHQTPEGRWDNPRLNTPMQQVSVGNYHRIVKAFFRFMVEEEFIDFNPMQRVKVAKAKTEIKPPISKEDFKRLLNAAKEVKNPHRELAILWTLWDSGVRASEFCNLKREDLDEGNLLMRVLGKGNRYRTVYIDPITVRSIQTYLRKCPTRRNSDRLFQSDCGKPLTANGLYQIIERLSKIAGIPCPGVHAFRRSFAVNMLRNQANAFSVQVLLGHADLTMTRRYCRIADADVAEQHRRCSPAANL